MVQHLLPDKAIDLVNEAASALHLAQESEPDELEALGREIMMLKIEREWLCAQSDAFSTEHHAAVEAVLTAKRTQTKECTIVLQAERVCLDRLKETKEHLEDAKCELEIMQQQGNFEHVSRLHYAMIPEQGNEPSAYLLRKRSSEQPSASPHGRPPTP